MESAGASSVHTPLQNHKAKEGVLPDLPAASSVLGGDSDNGSLGGEPMGTLDASLTFEAAGVDQSTATHHSPPSTYGVASTNSVCGPSVVAPSTVGASSAMESTDTNGRSEIGLFPGSNVSKVISHANDSARHPHNPLVGTAAASTTSTLPMSIGECHTTVNGASFDRSNRRVKQEQNISPEEQRTLSLPPSVGNWPVGNVGALSPPAGPGAALPIAGLNAPLPSVQSMQVQAGPVTAGGVAKLTPSQPFIPSIPNGLRQPFVSSSSRPPGVVPAASGVVPMPHAAAMPLQAQAFLMPHLAGIDPEQAMLSMQLPLQGKRMLAPKPSGARPRGRPPSSAMLPASHPPLIAPAPSTAMQSTLFSTLQQQVNLLQQVSGAAHFRTATFSERKHLNLCLTLNTAR